MQTISIGTIASPNGDRLYQAASGSRQSTGKTAGAALDALTAQMETQEIEGFLLLQNHQPDRLRALCNRFFTAQQQQRLTELMSLWRTTRDVDDSFPSESPIGVRCSNLEGIRYYRSKIASNSLSGPAINPL